jgi:hypothetical protein
MRGHLCDAKQPMLSIPLEAAGDDESAARESD